MASIDMIRAAARKRQEQNAEQETQQQRAARREVVLDAEATAFYRMRRFGTTRAQAVTYAALYHFPDWQKTFAAPETVTWETLRTVLDTGWDGEGPAMPEIPTVRLPRKRGGTNCVKETIVAVVAEALQRASKVETFQALVAQVARATHTVRGTVQNILTQNTLPAERRYVRAHLYEKVGSDRYVFSRVLWPLMAAELPAGWGNFNSLCRHVGAQVGLTHNSNIRVYMHREGTASQIEAIRAVFPDVFKTWAPPKTR